MRLVESVTTKRLYEGEDALGDPRVDAMLLAALDELLAILRQLRGNLLGHRLAELVHLAPAKAGELHRDLQHLVLVHDDAVRLAQQRLQSRMQILGRDLTMLGLDELRNRLHRAGTVERDHGRQVLDAGRLEVLDGGAHRAGLKLKDAGRFALAQQRVRLGVVVWQPV